MRRALRRRAAGAAGAVAGAYFTLHAAHAVPSLRVIDSPLVAGALLSAAAAVARSRPAVPRTRARRARRPPGARRRPGAAVPAAALVSAVVLVVAAFTLVVPDRGGRSRSDARPGLRRLRGAASPSRRVGGGAVSLAEEALAAGALLACSPPLRLAGVALRRARLRERSAPPSSFSTRARLAAHVARAAPRRATRPRGRARGLGGTPAGARGARPPASSRLSAPPVRRSGAGLVALAAAVAAWLFPLTAPMPLFAALSGMALAMAAEYVESALLRGVTLLVSLAAAALACTTADPAAAFLSAAVLAYTPFFVDRRREPSNPGSAFFAVASSAVVLAAALAHTAAARQPLTLAALGLVLIGLGHFACVRPLAAAGQIPIVAAYVLFLRRTDGVGALAATLVTLVAAGALANAWWRSLVAGGPLRAARRAATALHAPRPRPRLHGSPRVDRSRASARWLVVPAALALAAPPTRPSRATWRSDPPGRPCCCSRSSSSPCAAVRCRASSPRVSPRRRPPSRWRSWHPSRRCSSSPPSRTAACSGARRPGRGRQAPPLSRAAWRPGCSSPGAPGSWHPRSSSSCSRRSRSRGSSTRPEGTDATGVRCRRSSAPVRSGSSGGDARHRDAPAPRPRRLRPAPRPAAALAPPYARLVPAACTRPPWSWASAASGASPT